MSGYYPPGCTEDIFDREMERLSRRPQQETQTYFTVTNPDGSADAFEKLRRSLEATRCGCGPDYLDPDCQRHSAAAARRAQELIMCKECGEAYGHRDGCSRG